MQNRLTINFYICLKQKINHKQSENILDKAKVKEV